MLLRSITQHVKDQNWFAVALDFFIVVAGILIAFQITHWNEENSNKAGLVHSLERLEKEVALNIENSNSILQIIERGRDDLELARDALSKCEASPKTTAALERSLFHLVEDFQPNFVVVVLDQLARQDRYQDLFSASFQQDFGSYIQRLKEEDGQLDSHYNNMWFHHVNRHPDVNAYFAGSIEEWGFTLAKPFEEICLDASFRNRFINTIGFLDSIERRLLNMNTEIAAFQAALAIELEAK